jgi:hypothetical protein
MPLEKLPRTHRHAIKVCRRLGFRYLWIDALCILQLPHDVRDASAEEKRLESADKQRELPKMGMYYNNAHFTIAACEKNNCDGGLFFTRPKCEAAPVKMPYVGPDGRRRGFFFARTKRATFEDAVVRPPHAESQYDWWNRGWTVQERLMSRRTIYFARDRLFFECVAGETIAEDNESVDRVNGSRHSYMKISRMLDATTEDLDDWYRAVQAFSACTLSKKEDRERALLGIAEELGKKRWSGTRCSRAFVFGNDYVNGLWASDINRGLLWRVGTLGSRADTCPAPSWSWVSQTNEASSPIVWSECVLGDINHDSERTDLNLKLSPRVRIKESGYKLHLTGFIITAHLCSTPTTGAHKDFANRRYKAHNHLPPTYFLLNDDGQCTDGSPIGWAVLDTTTQPHCHAYTCLITSHSSVPLTWSDTFQKKPFHLASSLSSFYNLVKEPSLALWEPFSFVYTRYKRSKETMHGRRYLETVYVLLLRKTREKGCYSRVGVGQIHSQDVIKKLGWQRDNERSKLVLV